MSEPRLDLALFRSEISRILTDATSQTPDSVSVSISKIENLLRQALPNQYLRDPAIVKVLMTMTASAAIGKVTHVSPKDQLSWSTG